MSEALAVTQETFKTEVLKSSIPVLIDFWAPWCGPCRMIAPIVDQIAQEFTDKLKVVKVNTDENIELAFSFSITGIPTLLIFKQGKMVYRIVGAASKAMLVQKINQFIT